MLPSFHVPDWHLVWTHLEVAGGAFVTGWCTWTPPTLWKALRASWALKKGFPMPLNPIALVSASLTLGNDAVKLYKDLSAHDKPAAVAAALDALPALATLTNEPLADLQAIVTPEALGVAYDLEQDAVAVVPLIKAALAKYRGN